MKRYLIVVLLFSCMAVLSLYLYYQQIKPEDVFDVGNFPKEVSGWSSEDIPLEEKVYEILETRNLLLREYKKPNTPSIILYIIYSDKNRKVSHPPEVCLIGSGVTILNKAEQSLKINPSSKANTITVNSILAEKGNIQELMLYWFKSGDVFTPNYLSQQFRIMLRQLRGESSGGAMIRLSTRITKGEEDAMQRLTEFSKEIMPTVIKTIP